MEGGGVPYPQEPLVTAAGAQEMPGMERGSGRRCLTGERGEEGPAGGRAGRDAIRCCDCSVGGSAASDTMRAVPACSGPQSGTAGSAAQGIGPSQDPPYAAMAPHMSYTYDAPKAGSNSAPVVVSQQAPFQAAGPKAFTPPVPPAGEERGEAPAGSTPLVKRAEMDFGAGQPTNAYVRESLGDLPMLARDIGLARLIPLSIKERVWRKECIDIFSLLEVSAADWTCQQIRRRTSIRGGLELRGT